MRLYDTGDLVVLSVAAIVYAPGVGYSETRSSPDSARRHDR
jgi:hypothetical protein